MKEEGLFGSVDRACLRGCLCLCVCACVQQWGYVYSQQRNSACNCLHTASYIAAACNTARPPSQFLQQLCSSSSTHKRAYFNPMLHARSTVQILPHLQPLSIPVCTINSVLSVDMDQCSAVELQEERCVTSDPFCRPNIGH